MPHQQLSLAVPASLAEAVGDTLLLCDAQAVTLRGAHQSPAEEEIIVVETLNSMPLWQHCYVDALFEPERDLRPIIELIKKNHELPELPYEYRVLADQVWERVWLEHFKPMRFGERLWVCPHHQSPPPDAPEPICVYLDPGLAFGTGTHPTTALCLEWLEAHPPKNIRVMDYGSGSGILALAALKLGAQSVMAVDHDEQALTATQENGLKNGFDDKLLSIAGTESTADLPVVDLMLANILAAALQELAPYFAEHVRPDGHILLSGILSTQCEAVWHHYAPWFTQDSIQQRDDWICIVGKRKN